MRATPSARATAPCGAGTGESAAAVGPVPSVTAPPGALGVTTSGADPVAGPGGADVPLALQAARTRPVVKKRRGRRRIGVGPGPARPRHGSPDPTDGWRPTAVAMPTGAGLS